MTARKVILFELNEVPFKVLDAWCEAKPESAFARLRRMGAEFETVTEDRGHLSPWVTWPTLHRGVTDEEHTINHFGQNLEEIDQARPPIWKILANAGVKVGLGGSLHSTPLPPESERGGYAFYLPDTFAATGEAFPSELEAFQTFNVAMVAKNARQVDTSVGIRDALGVLKQVPKIGIKASTLVDGLQQILQERINPARRERRRVYQAQLAFDAVLKQLQTTRPQFATFFSNHVAANMHRYWAAAFPSDFEVYEYGPEYIKEFGLEILNAMRVADGFLDRLMRFAKEDGDYVVLVASSMGQEAVNGVPHASELIVTDLNRFMAAMGVEKGQWTKRPAMVPDYSAVVDDSIADDLEAKLRTVTIGPDRRPIQFSRREGNFFHMSIGGLDLDPVATKINVGNYRFPLSDYGIQIVASDFQNGCSAYHMPQGILLMYDPTGSVGGHGAISRRQVSTRDIAPSLLRHFNVPVPSYMTSGNLLG